MSASSHATARSLALSCILSLCTVQVWASDLTIDPHWTAMASDRRASAVGDAVSVLIYENAQATNSESTSATRSRNLTSTFTAASRNRGGQIGLDGSSSGTGQTGRSAQMIAQIGVVVDQLLPNGTLHISGEQSITINGKKTRISLRGIIRTADISSNNTVVSTAISEAFIEYGGEKFNLRKGGLNSISQIFSWFGLQ